MQHYRGHHYRYTPDEVAGEHLYDALTVAGLDPGLADHAGAQWVTVPAGRGEIHISNAAAGIDHHPRQHGGWTAEHNHDSATGPGSTIVYATGIRDFAADTVGVVGAVLSYLRDPAPWVADPDHHAACGPYVTAGELLRRALEASGVRALHLLTLGREGAWISVPVPQPGYEAILVTSTAGSVDHAPEQHPGWEAALSPNGTFGPQCTPVPIASKTDFTADTAATVRAISGHLGRWRAHTGALDARR